MSTEQPVLPYGGWRDPNSGFAAGSDTSEERARRDDHDGTTSRRQRQTLAFLSARGHVGATFPELGEQFGWHHGQSSGVLSVLHKDGKIARLTARRGRCSIYVLPEYVGERTTQPHGGKVRKDEVLQGRAELAEAELDRIRTNFANLLGVYTSDSSLVAVSRIRKCLDGKYP